MNSSIGPSRKIFRSSTPGKPFLLASDIDGTLVGDAEGERLIKLLVDSLGEDLHFAVITGRSLDSIAELVTEGRLPAAGFHGRRSGDSHG